MRHAPGGHRLGSRPSSRNAAGEAPEVAASARRPERVHCHHGRSAQLGERAADEGNAVGTGIRRGVIPATPLWACMGRRKMAAKNCGVASFSAAAASFSVPVAPFFRATDAMTPVALSRPSSGVSRAVTSGHLTRPPSAAAARVLGHPHPAGVAAAAQGCLAARKPPAALRRDVRVALFPTGLALSPGTVRGTSPPSTSPGQFSPAYCSAVPPPSTWPPVSPRPARLLPTVSPPRHPGNSLETQPLSCRGAHASSSVAGLPTSQKVHVAADDADQRASPIGREGER